jgi:hypothetical protein
MFKRLKNKRGISLILFLALLLMLTLVGVLAINNSLVNLDVSGNRNKTSNLIYAAEAGVEEAVARIRDYYDHNGTVMSSSSFPCSTFTLGGVSISYTTLCDSSTSYSCNSFSTTSGIVNTSSIFSGLRGLSISYRVVSEAWIPGLPHKTKIIQQVAVYHIPVFSFSAIYDTFDLEISPEANTPGFRDLNGRIHTNGNLYVEAPYITGTETGLRLQGTVSARKGIFHGHSFTGTWPTAFGQGGWGQSRYIYIRDLNGIDQLMKTNGVIGGTWIDENYGNWIDSSLVKWGGTVEDSAHKISDLYLKMVVATNRTPYDLIRRASQSSISLENSAGLKIWTQVNFSAKFGWTATNQATCDTGDGVQRICTNPLFSTNVSWNGVMDTVVKRVGTYDYRENDTVRCYKLDIGRLDSSRWYPANGIIYITRDGFELVDDMIYGVMITNAANLPRATTIVSNLPVYVVGNFNTALYGWPLAPQPAAIIADAVTILSGSAGVDPGPPLDTLAKNPTTWTSTTTLGDRMVLGNRTVNACIMAGNTPTTSSPANYSGGLWNLARLLEDWSNGPRTLTINGSMACFWRSQVANSAYRFPASTSIDPNPYYNRPSLTLTLPNNAPGQPVLDLVIKTKRSVQEL